jgi:hypothetical protein
MPKDSPRRSERITVIHEERENFEQGMREGPKEKWKRRKECFHFHQLTSWGQKPFWVSP